MLFLSWCSLSWGTFVHCSGFLKPRKWGFNLLLFTPESMANTANKWQDVAPIDFTGDWWLLEICPEINHEFKISIIEPPFLTSFSTSNLVRSRSFMQVTQAAASQTYPTVYLITERDVCHSIYMYIQNYTYIHIYIYIYKFDEDTDHSLPGKTDIPCEVFWVHDVTMFVDQVSLILYWLVVWLPSILFSQKYWEC